MKLLFTFFSLLFIVKSHSQDLYDTVKSNLTINFFNHEPINLHPYNNRVVPCCVTNPYYVSISFPKSNKSNFEYFRIDSAHYLRYEYFDNAKQSSNRGLKSSGVVRITDTIFGQLEHIVKKSNEHSPFGGYYGAYKELAKEGKWDEYEDSLFFHKYWTGNYLNNKKVGIWSCYIYDPNDDRLLKQFDYDKNLTVSTNSVNLVDFSTMDSLNYFLEGRWKLRCEDNKDRRMFLTKCQLYDGNYGDDCNNRFGEENNYEFFANKKFKRQKGETCNKFRQNTTTGEWKFTRIKNELVLEIKLSANYIIKYKVLYFDREGNMVADRQ